MSEDQREHERLMAKALEEMENQTPDDPTAATVVYQADCGRSTNSGKTTARVDGVVTSPKIVRHDRPYEMLRNAHPQLESSDIEELLEYCYGGESVYEASRTNFESFDPAMVDTIANMSEEEVEDLLDEEEDE